MLAKTRTLLSVALLSVVPFALGAGRETQTVTPLHHFELPCENCHESASNTASTQSQGRTIPGRVNGDINHLCSTGGCHNLDHVLDHPVGIKPKGAVPAGMPLDSRSRVTCLTCHDSAGFPDGSSHLDSVHGRILKRPGGIEFCGTCHMQMNGMLLEQSHWQFSTRAHLGSINPQSAFSVGDLDQSMGGLDAESRMCLSCHDEITVTIPPEHEAPKQKGRRWKNMSDHPIGMDYQYVALRKTRSYNFPLVDGWKIRLFDGRMGCGSCHSLYAQTPNYLVARYRGGHLCRRCHNK
ncbi:MAG: hypothetical protein ACYSX1_09455 [Planctomycetota bacterium]